MKAAVISAIIMVMFVFPSIVSAQEAAPVENPLKTEMKLLDSAFKNLIDSLIFNSPKTIEEPFEEVHKAKEKTEAALKKGLIKLPKNNNKIKEFIKMDEEFHHNMEGLIEASRKGDMKKVQDITHRLLNDCVQCHNRFRN